MVQKNIFKSLLTSVALWIHRGKSLLIQNNFNTFPSLSLSQSVRIYFQISSSMNPITCYNSSFDI